MYCSLYIINMNVTRMLNVVDAYCYIVQYKIATGEKIMSNDVAESIKQSTDCRTFRLRRPSSVAYQTVCMQLKKAYVAKMSCNQLIA